MSTDKMDASGRTLDGRKHTASLEHQVRFTEAASWLTPTNEAASWATPAHRDYRHANSKSFQERSNSTKGEQLNNQVVHHGPTSNGSPAATGVRGQLNPDFSRWLMGYSAAHLSCAPTATPSSLKSQRSSSSPAADQSSWVWF
jgi:flagellar hook-length control protein FliK